MPEVLCREYVWADGDLELLGAHGVLLAVVLVLHDVYQPVHLQYSIIKVIIMNLRASILYRPIILFTFEGLWTELFRFSVPFFRLICRPNRENRIPKKIVLKTINRVLLPSEVLELMSIFSSQSLFSRTNIYFLELNSIFFELKSIFVEIKSIFVELKSIFSNLSLFSRAKVYFSQEIGL